jgi:hypothetical protein
MIIEDAGKLHEDARKALSEVISTTENITLLKKIIASGESGICDDAFDRLVDLAFSPYNGEALLEIMVLCRKSGKMKERVDNRKAFISESTPF